MIISCVSGSCVYVGGGLPAIALADVVGKYGAVGNYGGDRRRRCNVDRPTEVQLIVMLHRGFAGWLVVGGQEFGSKQKLEGWPRRRLSRPKGNRKPHKIALELRCELNLVEDPLKIHGKCVLPLSSARSLDL